MATLKSLLGCISDHDSSVRMASTSLDNSLPTQRVKFGIRLEEAYKDNVLPKQLMDMLTYIARDGVTTVDLFRRPGNTTDLKFIVKKLVEGKDVDITTYNFYTLASVIKKFLLKIPGGVFGAEAENQLLNVLEIKGKVQQLDAINRIIRGLPKVSQELSSMLFGTWFRMSRHSEFNSMSSESVAKSVAGSLFHTCSDNPNMVNLASEVLQILIENFAASSVFGQDNVEFFARATNTRIEVSEKFKYEFDRNFIVTGDVVKEDERNGVPAGKINEVPSIEECLVLFEKVVAHDARTRGIDPVVNAISSSEFSENEISLQQERTSVSPNNLANGISAVSSLPTPHLPKAGGASSPHSCQSEVDRNPQECISIASYLSAPDVYQTLNQDLVPGIEHLSRSLNRSESVQRKQMLRLHYRNNWFLTNPLPNSVSVDSRFEAAKKAKSSTLGTDNSMMPSSFSLGILSRVEGQTDHNDTLDSNQTSSCNNSMLNSPAVVPPTSTNEGSTHPPSIPFQEESNPSESNTIIPDLSINHADLPGNTLPILLTPSEERTLQSNAGRHNDQTNDLPRVKYFRVQHCYGIVKDNRVNDVSEQESNSRC